MGKIYAQVVNGMINLIGGEEVGLPVNNEIATSVDITDVTERERPNVGWYYVDGTFTQVQPIVVPDPTTEEMLLVAYDKIAELEARIATLEGGTS